VATAVVAGYKYITMRKSKREPMLKTLLLIILGACSTPDRDWGPITLPHPTGIGELYVYPVNWAV
jgi:hypothetical protein